MRGFCILIVLALIGCDGLTAIEISECKKACAPAMVDEVTGVKCKCALPSTVVSAPMDAR